MGKWCVDLRQSHYISLLAEIRLVWRTRERSCVHYLHDAYKIIIVQGRINSGYSFAGSIDKVDHGVTSVKGDDSSARGLDHILHPIALLGFRERCLARIYGRERCEYKQS